ncbi:MAG: Putative ABC transporter permease protein [Anaerolineaceae bacterium 46_22]|jgi:putative ABC transport system permease protein|nr:MAG: Putative ABC transporter permease protein [Anaerolineaceae bacterium 46_22]
MKLIDVIKVASKSLSSNKLRSLLTVLGIIIGVAAVIIMIAVSTGTEVAIAEQINSLGANLVFVMSSFNQGGAGGGMSASTGGLVYSDAEAIASSVPHVAGVAVEQSTTQTIKYSNIVLEDVSILGTTPDFTTVREIEIFEGRFINDQDVERSSRTAVLGATIAEELFSEEYPIGQKISIGTLKLTVVGVFEEKGLVSGVDYDARVYVPITLVFDKLITNQFSRIAGDRVRMIYVAADDKENIDEVILQINLLLSKRHEVPLESPDFQISTQQDIIQTQSATTESFRMLLGWVAGVSLIVGGIGIMNIMLVSVTERTREIGIRQAVGATPQDIRMQFLTEAIILSLIGGFLGVIFGITGAWVFAKFGEMPTVVDTFSIVLAFVSAALVGILFGYLPANQAAKLDPIVALRHE